jgi:MFS family permease
MDSENLKIAALINKTEPITDEKIIPSPTEDEVENTKSEVKRCCFMELNPGISNFNAITFYLVQFSYVCAFTFIDSCQDYLLEDPKYYGISKNEVGTINGDILLFDTIYLIAFIYLYGSLHDILGRKILIVYGFISMGISLLLHPLAGNVYPNLILVRLIFSNGICAVTTQPLFADYVNPRSRGVGGGLVSLVSGLGAIFAALFLLKLQSYINLFEVYCFTAFLCFLVAFICAFGVKNVNRGETVVLSLSDRLYLIKIFTLL